MNINRNNISFQAGLRYPKNISPQQRTLLERVEQPFANASVASPNVDLHLLEISRRGHVHKFAVTNAGEEASAATTVAYKEPVNIDHPNLLTSLMHKLDGAGYVVRARKSISEM